MSKSKEQEPSGSIGNILVLTDHFTKFAKAVPRRNQTAKTTAETFFENVFTRSDIPVTLHTDQEANFESELVIELPNYGEEKVSYNSVSSTGKCGT